MELYYSSKGIDSNVESIKQELTTMLTTTLKVECDGECCPENELLKLRQEITSFLEQLVDDKQILISTLGFGKSSFVKDGISYIKTIVFQIEIVKKNSNNK